eukprot:5001412-Amphidinium_carterae.1
MNKLFEILVDSVPDHAQEAPCRQTRSLLYAFRGWRTLRMRMKTKMRSCRIDTVAAAFLEVLHHSGRLAAPRTCGRHTTGCKSLLHCVHLSISLGNKISSRYSETPPA